MTHSHFDSLSKLNFSTSFSTIIIVYKWPLGSNSSTLLYVTLGPCFIRSIVFLVHFINFFDILLTHSHNHWWPVLIIILLRLLHIFSSLFKWNYANLFCVYLTQVLCKRICITSNTSNLFHSVCVTVTQGFIFFIWVILTHSYIFAARTPPYIFLHYLSGHSTWVLLGHFLTYFCYRFV